MAEAKITSQEIDIAREFYRPAAARASLLYFILNDLNSINPIYQFSLKAFSVVFQKAIAKAESSDEVEVRVKNLIDCISFSVYQYTSRGLYNVYILFILFIAFRHLIQLQLSFHFSVFLFFCLFLSLVYGSDSGCPIHSYHLLIRSI